MQQVKPQKYAQALFEMGVPRDTIHAFYKWMYDNILVWKLFEAEALRQWNLGRRNSICVQGSQRRES